MYLYPSTVPRPPAQQHNSTMKASNFFIGFTFIFCYWFWIVTTHNTQHNNQQPTNDKPLPHSRPHYRTNPLVCCKTRTCLNTLTPALFFSLSIPQNEGLLYWYMSVGDKNCGRKNRKVGLLLRRGQREV